MISTAYIHGVTSVSVTSDKHPDGSCVTRIMVNGSKDVSGDWSEITLFSDKSLTFATPSDPQEGGAA